MKKILLIMTLSLLIVNSPKTATAREHPYFILDIAISSDGRYIAITRIDDKLVLFDKNDEKIIKVFENKEGMQSTVAFTKDSKYFVFQNAKHDLFFYNIEKGQITNKHTLESGVYSIDFFKDGNRFIWGSGKGKIEYVDILKNEKIQLKPLIPENAGIGFEKPILSIKISPDENYFLTTTFTRGTRDMSPEPEEDMKLIEKGHLYLGNPTPDVYKFRNLGLNLWDAKTLKKIKKLTAYFLEGRTWPSFSPDGKYILAGSENGTVVFKVPSGEIYTDNPDNERYFTANGSGFILQNNDFTSLYAADAHLHLIKFSKNLKNHEMKIIKPHPCTGALVTLPDKNLIIIGTRDGSISVYRYLPDKNDIKLEWHPKPIASGIIRWISPLTTSYMKPTEIEELEKQYKEEQRKIIEQEKKLGAVETKYNQITVPSK